MSYDVPFAGLKVVDLSQGIAGPYCAMLLAQHGADVIKVESIGDGDWARTLGVHYGSHSAFSIIGNLGKRVIMRGFIVSDFVNRWAQALRQMGEWVKSGRIKYREDVVQGIDKAPRAFIGLLRGENFGKLLVKM